MMTKNFCNSENITFAPFTTQIMDGITCKALHYISIDTFYSVAVSRRFGNLPGTPKDEENIGSRVAEGNTFIIELPRASPGYQSMCEKVAIKCGCQYLVVKQKPDRISKFF